MDGNPPREAISDPRQATAIGDPSSDQLIETSEFEAAQLPAYLRRLRDRMLQEHGGHVPTGSVLHDGRRLAQELGFGEGTSIYDDTVVYGNVRIGRDCSIGAFAVLDAAQGDLNIGDFTSIGTGTYIYTHDSIARFMTGHPELRNTQATQIGSHCYIAPHVLIGPGTQLGDYCLVETGSYVTGRFPSFSYISGIPARRIGTVVVQGERVVIQRTKAGSGDDDTPRLSGENSDEATPGT